MLRFNALLTIILFTSVNSAHAYYLQQLNGDITEVSHYKIGLDYQAITNPDSGGNFVATVETGLNSESTLITRISFGQIDFAVAADYKWVPFPDTEGQPALGAAAGLVFARFDGETEFTVKVAPFVSKKFALDYGDFTPYAAVPVNLKRYAGDMYSPSQFTFGCDVKTFYFENVLFNFEVGADLNDAFTYISIGALIEVDDKDGFKIKKID